MFVSIINNASKNSRLIYVRQRIRRVHHIPFSNVSNWMKISLLSYILLPFTWKVNANVHRSSSSILVLFCFNEISWRTNLSNSYDNKWKLIKTKKICVPEDKLKYILHELNIMYDEGHTKCSDTCAIYKCVVYS